MIDQHVGKGMGDDVIDGVKRLIVSDCQCAGGESADQERTKETRTSSDGDAVDIVPADLGGDESLAYDGEDGFDVATRGDFWYNATKGRVKVDLASDGVGQDLASITHHSGRRLVTGGLNAKYYHGFPV